MTLKTRQAMELHTKRLHLRRPADRDIVSIIAIAGDWEVSRRLGRVLIRRKRLTLDIFWRQ